MRQTGKFIFAFGTLLFIALLAYTSACKREPVYIGYIDPNPIDTTGGPGDTTIITPPPPVTHPCDPDSVYFTQQILPILTSNCAMSGCHNAASHEEGVILDNYTNTRNTGKINLGSPSNSKLYRVLNQTNERMPPAPMAALPLDQRALILKWIQQGALNLTCDADCDTTNVTFTTSVMPIITLKCKGCHSGTNPSGNIALTNYTQVKATVTSGTLMGSILHQAGYVAMPQPIGSAQLPDCDISKLQIWIAAGAPNN
ncbi:MAG TPA: hypothetical protein PLO67_12600 [Saprospiraceae bacterium]|nr:hypothetical protein [Saprospiraceae bacterium]HPI08962.1 hypothetical protein [Saprospiraceae bacterium]